MSEEKKVGADIYKLAKTLWPINRSITGQGVRQTLKIIKNVIPNLKIVGVRSGTKVFDWQVPLEWKLNDAYIITPEKKRICDFKKNNLHVVGYSAPIKKKISLATLQKNLFSLVNQPKAIPYVTSYYKKNWGFCISDFERKKLKKGNYQVLIDSVFFKGELNYGELLIKGKTKKEIFLSTYVCHPSMANNELSGPCVTTYLAKWILKKKFNKYSYRIIFIPETIGSITYLSKFKNILKKNVVAGFNVTCVGDDRTYSFLPSKYGNTLSDQAARHVLKWLYPKYKTYDWSSRGSDERQYCAPNINLPIATIMRSKYGEYPEYHTSLDNLTKVVSPTGLYGGYHALKLTIEAIEKNFYPKTKFFGEPFLSKRKLKEDISVKKNNKKRRESSIILDIISWSDGNNSLIEIADKLNMPIWELYSYVNKLINNKIIY